MIFQITDFLKKKMDSVNFCTNIFQTDLPEYRVAININILHLIRSRENMNFCQFTTEMKLSVQNHRLYFNKDI